MRTVIEFNRWSEILLKDVDFSGAERIMWDPDRQCCVVHYPPPPGETKDGLEYTYLAEAIARMVAVRSRRRDPETGELRPPIQEWWPLVKLEFSPLFDRCPSGREVGHGWVDLTLTLADHLWSAEGTLRFEAFASRDGSLRIVVNGYDVEQHFRLEVFELVSEHVCETCGAPGRSYGGDAIQPAAVACDLHKPALEDEDKE